MNWRIEATSNGRVLTWFPQENTRAAAIKRARALSREHRVAHVLASEESRDGEHDDVEHITLVAGNITSTEKLT